MTATRFSLDLAEKLKAIVGSQYTLTDADKKKPYSNGIRLGGGEAYAVVRPSSLVEIWKVFKPVLKQTLLSLCKPPILA